MSKTFVASEETSQEIKSIASNIRGVKSIQQGFISQPATNNSAYTSGVDTDASNLAYYDLTVNPVDMNNTIVLLNQSIFYNGTTYRQASSRWISNTTLRLYGSYNNHPNAVFYNLHYQIIEFA